MSQAARPGLDVLLKALRLPTMLATHGETAARAEREGWGFSRYLTALGERELADREVRRIDRLRQQSRLPADKTLATLDLSRLPAKVKRLLPTLCEGSFVAAGEIVLAFGLPGRGKSHCLCAVGHELVTCGHSVLAIPACRLVQDLLAAKRGLALRARDQAAGPLRSRAGGRHRLRAAGPREDGGAVHLPGRPLRTEERDDHEQPRVLAMGQDLQGPDDDCGGDRPPVHHATILELTDGSYRGDAAKKRTRAAPESGKEESK